MTQTLVPDHVRVFGRDFEYKWIVAMIYVSALFLDVLDVTIVNVALPSLGRQLHSDKVEWVVIGYTLSLAVSIPAAGWWSDRIGTKKAFLTSLTLFIGSSMLCGFAQSMTQLVTFRVIQGVGGGMLTPIGMAMMYRAFPPAERVRAATFIMIPTLLAPALGPIVGGLIVTHVGWRWIFWINWPIGLAAFIFGFMFLREHREPTAGRFDIPGFFLGGGGLALSVFALSDGPTSGWTSKSVVIPAVLGVTSLITFVLVELRVQHPMIQLRLFKNRMFRNANIVMGLSMAAFLGLLFILPLYLQNLRGYSALRSGLTTFPQAIGVGMATMIASRAYKKIGPRRLISAGLVAAAILMLGFTHLTLHTSPWAIRFLMFGRGLCTGMSFMPLQASTYATIKPSDTGRASSIYSTTRQISISVGVALLATVLTGFTTLTGHPADVNRALDGYRTAAYVAVGLAAAAGISAFFLIKDEDAAGVMAK